MRANFGLNLAAWNGIDTEIGGILNSEYLAFDFWLCLELKKSFSPSVCLSVYDIFVNSSLHIHVSYSSCLQAVLKPPQSIKRVFKVPSKFFQGALK